MPPRWRLSQAGESLFAPRITTQLPTPPTGRDLSAVGFFDDGAYYFCKDDDGHRPIRATEMLFYVLAEHVGIATAQCEVVEVDGRLLFGSKKSPSIVDEKEVARFVSQAARNELGGRSGWKGGYFARLFVFDTFVGNDDRSANNLVAEREGALIRIKAIDFASAGLLLRPEAKFPVSLCNTSHFARAMDTLHTFDMDAAVEMVGAQGGVPTSFIESALDRMPTEWLDAGLARRFLEFWGGSGRTERLAKLRAGLKDGSLY